MKLKTYSVALLTVLFLSACKKDYSLELYQPPAPVVPKPPDPPDPKPVDTVEVLHNFLSSKQFKLVGFYSDIAIDFVETDDVVKEETNLWGYVAGYLKDDVYQFYDNNSDVHIEQHEQKMPGLSDEVLNKNYAIGEDSEGIYMTFLDAQYNPFEYRLHEIGDTYFIIAVPWNQGATLFTRFELVQ